MDGGALGGDLRDTHGRPYSAGRQSGASNGSAFREQRDRTADRITARQPLRIGALSGAVFDARHRHGAAMDAGRLCIHAVQLAGSTTCNKALIAIPIRQAYLKH